MVAELFGRSDTHKQCAAAESDGSNEPNHRPDVTVAQHGATSAAHVPAISAVHNYRRLADVTLNGGHH